MKAKSALAALCLVTACRGEGGGNPEAKRTQPTRAELSYDLGDFLNAMKGDDRSLDGKRITLTGAYVLEKPTYGYATTWTRVVLTPNPKSMDILICLVSGRNERGFDDDVGKVVTVSGNLKMGAAGVHELKMCQKKTSGG